MTKGDKEPTPGRHRPVEIELKEWGWAHYNTAEAAHRRRSSAQYPKQALWPKAEVSL